jgi:glutamyl-tRNA synthetase
MKDRVTFPEDFWEHGKFFFQAPRQFDEAVIAKKWNDDAVKVLGAYCNEIRSMADLTAETAKAMLEKVTADLGIKTGQILQALRMSITGGASGPDLMMTLEILGNAEVVNRIRFALDTLKVKAV